MEVSKWILAVVLALVSSFSDSTLLLDEEATCMSVVRQLAGRRSVTEGNVAAVQGRSGKRGAEGPPGPRGPQGAKGDPGSCRCDLGEIQRSLEAKIEKLQGDVDRMKSIPGACYMGITSGVIPISDITASNTHAGCPIANIRLNSHQSWCSSANQPGTWILVNLKSPKYVAGIVTKGRYECCNQWVTTYKVSFGSSPHNMEMIRERGSDKVFQANSDGRTPVENRFPEPVTARFIRIIPISYNNHMSMRMDLLAC